MSAQGVPRLPVASVRRAGCDDRGGVAAELAVALPAVLLVLMLGVGALGAASRQVALQDAVADAARLLGRGEDTAAAVRVVDRAVPGARASFTASDGLVCTTATVRVSVGAVIGFPLRASSCALGGGR